MKFLEGLQIIISSGVGMTIATIFYVLLVIILKLTLKSLNKTIETINKKQEEKWENFKEFADMERIGRMDILTKQSEHIEELFDICKKNCTEIKTIKTSFNDFKEFQQDKCNERHSKIIFDK
jgi:uncharacterized membrane protein YhiD involved in acid resistance